MEGAIDSTLVSCLTFDGCFSQLGLISIDLLYHFCSNPVGTSQSSKARHRVPVVLALLRIDRRDPTAVRFSHSSAGALFIVGKCQVQFF